MTCVTYECYSTTNLRHIRMLLNDSHRRALILRSPPLLVGLLPYRSYYYDYY